MKEFVDETIENEGTPINRTSMMAIQGFIGNRVTFEDNKVIQINSEGHRLETTFNEDGSVTEVFIGKKTITKTIYFNEDRSITEVIS